MDFSFQQSITNAVTSAIATTIATIQAKYKGEILSLWEMIKKSLLLRESPSATPSPNPKATPKAHPSTDFLPKTIIERWNQTNLGYFDPYFDMAYGEGEIALVGKDMYYWNIVLFV